MPPGWRAQEKTERSCPLIPRNRLLFFLLSVFPQNVFMVSKYQSGGVPFGQSCGEHHKSLQAGLPFISYRRLLPEKSKIYLSEVKFMKVGRYLSIILLTCLAVLPLISGAEDKQAETQVFMPETQFTFQPVVEGTEVVHDFAIMNKGADTLSILNVKTSCGCTAVSYTRQVPAGGEGKITLKVNTTGYGGTLLKKSVQVETSAAKQPNLTLEITGNVEKFANITPNKLILRGNAGEPISGSATIAPDPKYPFKVLETKAKTGTDIRVEIEDKQENNATVYILTVENLKKDPGRYYDVILLKTDSLMKPELQLSVYGQILESQKKAQ